MTARSRFVVAVLVALPLAVTGCSSGGTPSAGSSAPAAASPRTPSSSVSAMSVARPGRFARYAALGDSYTAAPGLPGPTVNDDCGRAEVNYPHLLGEALAVADLADVSCGGASTADVRRSQAANTPPQIDAVTPATDLVTIGLGGNDLDTFGTLVGACVQRDAAQATGSPCADRLRAQVPSRLQVIERNVAGVVEAVRARAPRARIVLVGYPQIVPAAGTCEGLPFAPGDYPFARSVNHGFTEAVRKAAVAEKVTYIDVWAASRGHDVCAAEPWVNGIAGPGAAPFHPFAVEQQAVARLLLDALQ